MAKTNGTHVVIVPAAALEGLRKWLADPDASHRVGDRLVFEAVEGNMVMIKTEPYREPRPVPRSV